MVLILIRCLMATLLDKTDSTSLQSTLYVGSYNCRGFGNPKQHCIVSLLNQVGILFLQEHWFSDAHLHTLNDIDKRFAYHGVSGFSSDEKLAERAYVGCAIFEAQLPSASYICPVAVK